MDNESDNFSIHTVGSLRLRRCAPPEEDTEYQEKVTFMNNMLKLLNGRKVFVLSKLNTNSITNGQLSITRVEEECTTRTSAFVREWEKFLLGRQFRRLAMESSLVSESLRTSQNNLKVAKLNAPKEKTLELHLIKIIELTLTLSHLISKKEEIENKLNEVTSLYMANLQKFRSECQSTVGSSGNTPQAERIVVKKKLLTKILKLSELISEFLSGQQTDYLENIKMWNIMKRANLIRTSYLNISDA